MSSGQYERVDTICHLLDAAYGRPELDNHADPVDEVTYILLSMMTTEVNYQRSFASLRAAALWRYCVAPERGRYSRRASAQTDRGEEPVS